MIPIKLITLLAEKPLIIYVNPSEINYYLSEKKWPITTRISFVIPNQYYNLLPIEMHGSYKKMKDLFENINDYKSSKWYNDILNKITNEQIVKHKELIIRNENDLARFFEDYLISTINSMRNEGFNLEKSSDLPLISIGENGELHRSVHGRHRFAIARFIGLELMPFRINRVHSGWLKKMGITNNVMNSKKLIEIIRNFIREEERSIPNIK